MSITFDIAVHCTSETPPTHDLFCSLMSLPYALGMTIDTVPFPDRYLAADAGSVADWRTMLEGDVADGVPARAPLRVGLVWSGGRRPWHLQTRLMDERRSTGLSTLAPLARCADRVLFYSLQIGGPAAEAADPPPGLRVIDHTARIGDFADTAALVSLLDLVIAVDTSTAHLAGALGRPVWLLSRYDQCWRWLPGRTDTPWYDSMRVYTQPAPFDWATPVEAVARDLAAQVGAAP